jgi:hypothetical protein
MTLTLSVFRGFSHVWHRRRLLTLGSAGGNRLCIAYARSYAASAMSQAVDSGIGPRCVAAAKRHFSLDEGVRRYASIYKQLDSDL